MKVGRWSTAKEICFQRRATKLERKMGWKGRLASLLHGLHGIALERRSLAFACACEAQVIDCTGCCINRTVGFLLGSSR